MYLGSILKHGNTMIFGKLVKGIHNIIRVYVVLYYYRYYAHSECHHRGFLWLNSLTPLLISTELVDCISTNQKLILNHISIALSFCVQQAAREAKQTMVFRDGEIYNFENSLW